MRNNHFEGDGSGSRRPPDYTPEQGEQARLELEARERARIAEAQRQATEEAVKRETGELPIIDDSEAALIARRYGIK